MPGRCLPTRAERLTRLDPTVIGLYWGTAGRATGVGRLPERKEYLAEHVERCVVCKACRSAGVDGDSKIPWHVPLEPWLAFPSPHV